MTTQQKLGKYLVELADLSLSAKGDKIVLLIRKIARYTQKSHPEISNELLKILQNVPSRMCPIESKALPVDIDNRDFILNIEKNIEMEKEPILFREIKEKIDWFFLQREKKEELFLKGLVPSRTIIMTGGPGTGKTITAKFISQRLNLPLVTINIANCINSHMGSTGRNIQSIFEYAKTVNCVLFLDEIDAIATTRGDRSDTGEMTRVVCALLQQIDLSENVVISATNTPQIIDHAIWRRFDIHLNFDTKKDIEKAIIYFMGKDFPGCKRYNSWLTKMEIIFEDYSYAEIKRVINDICIKSILKNIPITEAIEEYIASVPKNQD